MTDTTLTITEAAAALGVGSDYVPALLGGADAYCRISMSQLLGCRIIKELSMIGAEEARDIALAAFMEADATKSRMMCVGWRADGQRVGPTWLDHISPELLKDISKAMLVVPLDRWLRELTEAVTANRAAMARLN